MLRHATRRENREPILKHGLLARASPRRNYPDSDDFYECGWSYTPGFGYKLNKDKRPVVVQKDARIVREIFRRRANGEEIASLASEFGLPVTQVRHILGNRLYLGEVRLEEGKGKFTTLKNHHAPIIASEGAWQAAQIKGELSRA